MAVALTLPPSAIRLRRAHGFWDRLVGLAWRSVIDPDEAFLIEQCRAVHTFGMRVPIDVVFISEQGVVMSVFAGLAPCRIAACLSGAHVIEFACGLISRLQIMPGDQILFEPSALTITRKAAGGHRDQFELDKRV